MDRVFLDANVLFSASYRSNSGLLRLWQLQDTELITSSYALEEAHRNLPDESQRTRLNNLLVTLVSPPWKQGTLPASVVIVDKDLPIILDAINSQATHLLTGDKQHFGSLYGTVVGGVMVLPPAEYIALRTARDGNVSDIQPE